MNSKPKKRGRVVSNRREEILQVAAKLFASRGFEAASIREIGDAAGILSGSLYHHFKSKDEMLHDLLKRFVDKLVPLYESVLAESEDVSETLSNLIAAGLKVSLDHSSELTVIMHERKFLNRNPEFSYVNEVMLEVERIWYGVLQEGVRSGAFRSDLDMNLVLRMIMDLISSTVIWYTPKSRYTQDQIVNNQIKLLFSGLAQ
ncbi:HTH-type transcriptional repressor KstR2 [Halioglobus japonicus]|nr:HTH-type transcriptional repressor KstR2 [Halioglobus japonicus]